MWQYMIYSGNPDLDTLNSFGAQGWELVAVCSYTHYFKKPA